MPYRRHSFTSFVVAALLLAACRPRTRYEELRHIVDRNTGHMHFQRGMNRYTLIALRSCVAEPDIPVLQRLLHDEDRVTVMTAARVLADLSPQGEQVLAAELAAQQGPRYHEDLQEVLAERRHPGYRILLADGIPEQVKGCSQ